MNLQTWSKFFLVFVTVGGFSFGKPLNCGEVAFQPAKKCTELKVMFDLTKCGEKVSYPAEVSCDSREAIARVTVPGSVYVARIRELSNGVWAVFGGIDKMEFGSKDKEAETKKEIVSDLLVPKTIQFGASIDTYYSYNFNQPTAVTVPSSSSAANLSMPNYQTGYRKFDGYHNQLGLALVELSASKKGSEVGFQIDLDFGQTMDATHRSSDRAVDEVSKHIGTAVISYSPKAIQDLSIHVGKMWSHIGSEKAKSKENSNYSRSFLYSLGIPYWHTGIEATYKFIPELFQASLFLYNGWNTLYENNADKTYGFQMALTPVSGVRMVYNLILGAEQIGDSHNRKYVNNFILDWKATEQLRLKLEGIYAYAKQEIVGTNLVDGKWQAVQIGASYKLNSLYAISPRIEWYNDEYGYTTGAIQKLYGATLTNTFYLGDGLETRFELRYDHSDRASFSSNEGNKPNQFTATWAMLYSL